jgi:plastocyanin
MRFNGIALFASAALLAACGGGSETKTDSAAPAAEPTPAVSPAAGTVTAAPVTGTVHEVKMIGDAQGYRFDPVALTVKVGDAVNFVMVSGGPHNIAFDAATVPEDQKAQLQANMPNSPGELSSPMMMNANEAWQVSLGNIKPGTYTLICTPHLAMGMKMDLTVQ